MTICIAAICDIFPNQPGIVFCADRLLSAGLEFEGNPKIKVIPNRAVVLEAGSALISDLVLDKDFFKLANKASELNTIATNLYEKILKVRESIIDNQILYKYGFKLSNFSDNASKFSENIIGSILDEIEDFDLGIEFIIAGIDTDGSAHLFRVGNKGIFCLDSVGFVSIGTGSDMCLIEMTKSPQDGKVNLKEMIVKVYSAKKNSERMEGVGQATDLGLLYPKMEKGDINAELMIIKQDIKEILDSELEKIRQQELRIKDKISNKIERLIYGPTNPQERFEESIKETQDNN